jgi:predicted metalloprotease with PDZ domain
VIVPSGWRFGTALTPTKSGGNITTFAQTTIRHLEDSPVITGLYFKEIPLAPGVKPQHFLDVAADTSQDLDQNLTPEFLAALNKLVPEAWAMYGSHDYASYHFLLTLSDFAGHHGQEHQESSNNGGSQHAYSDPAQAELNGELLPHEFTHSWNGKYRCPVGLDTPDFATPMKGELLWVYEGRCPGGAIWIRDRGAIQGCACILGSLFR